MYDPLDSPLQEIYPEGLSKAQQKKMRRAARRGRSQIVSNHLELRSVVPKTKNQTRAFEEYEAGKNLLLTGVAGTGKTYIATYLGLCTIMDESNSIDKMVIVRSAVPTRDIGFLPGTAKDKMEVYEAPYEGIFGELFGNDTAYSLLKLKDVVEFIPTSFVRGRTLDDTVVIIEEIQNMTDSELNSVITRLGKNTRLILAGDHRQNDLAGKRGADASGIKEIVKVFSHMKSIAKVEFTIDDVQRSAFVKEYLRARLELGLDTPLEL